MLSTRQAQLRELQLMQAQYGDKVQFVGVTGISGMAWEFPDGKVRPGKGKVIRAKEGRIKTETEVGYLRKFIMDYKLKNFPVLVESPRNARKELNVTEHPTTFVIGRDGKVVGHVHGFVSGHKDAPTRRRLSALVQQAMDG